jgi:hemerythrin-like domain-containing protein
MPIQIGVSAHSFSNPTGLLSDCHRRIEMFLGTLQAVAQVIDRPLSDDVAGPLRSALRYFREAAPNHTADEEESLFPRLRQLRHPDVETALAQLDHLEKDHRWAAPLHAEVERLGKEYLLKKHLSLAGAQKFRAAVRNLASMYRWHINVEDTFVFPVAARLLSRADQSSIGEEMAARRKVQLPEKTSHVHNMD